VFAYLAQGLRARRDSGLAGLTLLSCDNLADNGTQLQRLLGEYLEGHDPALRGWFERECTCPLTMVDRIVPATTDADRAEVRDLLGGLDDRACVVTEPFSQWVIEDRFAGPRPGWDKVGAQLVGDVRPYETAKLRMLNGAHSALAYIGLARGHEFVHQAIADSAIRPVIESLMLSEAAPTIAAAPGHDLGRYAAELLERFANPALNHRLMQIAMDGSQKVPQRWLETLAANRAMGRDCPAILTGIWAWIQHLRGSNGSVDDPRATELGIAAKSADPVQTIFGSSGLLASNWVPSEADRSAICAQIV
jgi:fructuronate reductase